MSEIRALRIVVGLDLSERSDVVLERALDLASRHQASELHVLTVIRPARGQQGTEVPDEELDTAYGRAQELTDVKLNDFGYGADKSGDRQVFLHVRVGTPADEIADLAWEVEADQIVVGRHNGKEPRFSRVGTVTTQLLRLARCPVLVVQPTDYGVTENLDEQRSRQCPACVAIRQETQGGTWFCQEHRGYKLSRRVYMAHQSGTWPIGGGPLL